jgi:hypothetical protein
MEKCKEWGNCISNLSALDQHVLALSYPEGVASFMRLPGCYPEFVAVRGGRGLFSGKDMFLFSDRQQIVTPCTTFHQKHTRCR